MATVGIWKVESSLNQVIKYVSNKEKIDLSNFQDLDNSLEYIKDEFKTEEKLFISGINCDPDTSYNDMVRTKKRFNKENGILGFHAYQSFKEGEVTPEQAHQIGIELAKELWGDRFEVVVATHLNTNHYHNHFVINSVSFKDGKRYYDNRTSYAEFRRVNDLICEENNISHLQEKKTRKGINYLNYQMKGIEYSNYYKSTKNDIDYAISISKTYEEFIRRLENMNYEITYRKTGISLRNKNYKRNIRIERYYGNDYSVENIKKQIAGLYISESYINYKKNRKQKSFFDIISKPKYNSFYSSYIRYCNILKNNPNFSRKYRLSNDIKEEAKLLDKYSEQAELLVSNNIETEEQFFSFYNDRQLKVASLKNKREELRLKNNDENKEEIYSITQEIKKISNQIKICRDIEDRKEIVKDNLKEMEMVIDEYVK